MDGLIAILLIILGIAAVSSKARKKQAKGDGETPSPAEAAVPETTKIPFTREEWAAFLRESADDEITAGAPKAQTIAGTRPVQRTAPASAEPRAVPGAVPVSAGPRAVPGAVPVSAEPRPVQAKAVERELRPAAAPRPIMRTPIQHREGEHPRVHAAHVQRIAQEEEKLRREREELRELRDVNLKKLRSAVVMSEVLGKPVSLRPRGRL